ncbi:chemotaxis protein CheC [Caloranaerobacter azorensis DSM 13643]|uniref:Chemotaxis protein CheC n=1 Tax=Caloranaerobacter azorensis DSM 13643 TaxID=1121264 RepID=A0A1M5RKZ1_9FIRM|nr:chemotaxis protein CheC [Caloranaerobacter azorensis]SHH26819.1 chemotaxis protein CheC [Caloranaerobacter azorensis DSM 13643]
MDINNLNIMLLDILKEIGNIGSGNAATALANIINEKIDMDVPQVKILDFNEVANVLGGAEKPVVGIYFEMNGDIKGSIMFILDIDSARCLLKLLFKSSNEKDEFTDMDMSALSEVGNILAASYINSLSMLSNMVLKISVPSIAFDMAGAILSVPAIQFGYISDKVLFIETQFKEGNNQVTGNLFLIPELDSFETMLKKLGVVEI